MNAGRWVQMRMQLGYGARYGSARITRADDGAAGFVYEIVGDQQTSCSRDTGLFEGAPAGNERKILLAGLFERRHAADDPISFALPRGFQPGGQFLDTQAFELLQVKGY